MFNGKKEGYLEFVKHNTDPVKVKAGQSKKEKDKTEVIDESDDEDGEDEEYLDEQGNVVDPDASHDLIAPPIPVNHDDDEKSMKDTVEAGVDMERSSFDDLM